MIARILGLTALAPLLGILLTACSESSTEFSAPAPSPVATTQVTLSAGSYIPATIVVKIGTTVTWTNKDTITHSVTSNNNLFNRSLNPGSSFNRIFGEIGTFQSHSNLQPEMIGAVIVEK